MYNSNLVHSPEKFGAADRFKDMISAESERLKPIIGEHFLRNYILGMGDTDEIFNLYCRAFDVDKKQDVRMSILKPSGAKDFEDFFFIQNTVGQYLGEESILLNTIINDFIFVITTKLDRGEIAELLDKIRITVGTCYGYDIMTVFSKTAPISEAPAVYERLKVCMGYSFYSDSSRTLYENDIKINNGDITLRPEYGAIERSVQSGDKSKLRTLLSSFFRRLRSSTPAPSVAATYCLELYVCMIRCCSVEKIDAYMKGMSYIQDAKSLAEIQAFIEEKGFEITSLNTPESHKVYSTLIRDTMNIIDENIENENLSLRWLAGTILYTNVDYLGKLFKKETGKNFSHYVMEKRMEMAKELILEGKKDRIYEIAENVGYGSNSQYFSQVFKKYTGVSPLEYKEFARLAREKKAAENNS